MIKLERLTKMFKMFSSVAFLLPLALSASAALTEARASFEREFGQDFNRTTLIDHELAPRELDFERAEGRGSYRIVLPYAEDMRVRFVTARFDRGRFDSGTLHVLGLDARKLDKVSFERLRKDYPMVALKMDGKKENGVSVLYPARSLKPSYAVANDYELAIDPVSRQMGSLSGSVERLGMSKSKLAYRVTLTGRDGKTADLGVATAKQKITETILMENVRRTLEERYPKRKGQISNRDIVDYRRGGTISYRSEIIDSGK